MSRRGRPSVTTRAIADTYSGPGERIVEFNANDGTGRGGLLALRIIGDTLHLSLYRLSDGIVVDVDPRHIRRTEENIRAMRAASRG